MVKSFCREIEPDYEGLLRCITRQGIPDRVHFIELFLDVEIQDAICERFGLLEELDRSDPFFTERKQVAVMSFLGYDFVTAGPEGADITLNFIKTADVAQLPREQGRFYIDEHRGSITTWEEFETYPWPDTSKLTTRALEWYEQNVPDGMCVIPFHVSHYAEHLTWLMGYETLCYALYDQRDLVAAVYQKIDELFGAILQCVLQFDCVKAIWGSDDMGFRTGTLIGPDDLREFVLPGHKRMAQMSHDVGRPYLLHSCGNLSAIMKDLIEDVKIDAKHSFEDTILSVTDAKKLYGDRIALLGGIDMDFLCRATEPEVRARVRETLDVCTEHGGYCLGTGNSVANYIPLDNYLAMLDEGRRFMM